MKFFRKYYLVLPPVALLYGIYVWQMKYPNDGIPQTMMDDLVNGWFLLWIVFAALAAGVVYQLQQNKKQQYIYSLPMTKKDIYKKSLFGLHISLLIAELVYGIFFGMKISTIPNADPYERVIACTLLNACFCVSLCAITQAALFVTSYIWQGLIAALAAIYIMVPMILQNVTFVLQMLFKIDGYTAGMLSWVIYATDRNVLYPLNYMQQISYNSEGGFAWDKQYMTGMMLCIAGLLLAAVLCFWFAKKQFEKQNLAQNRMLTRMSQTANKNIMTVVIGILIFNLWSNDVIERAILAYDERTLENVIYEIIVWNKDVMADGSNLVKLLQKLNSTQLLIGFVVIFVVTYVAISLIQTIRRKRYERAC